MLHIRTVLIVVACVFFYIPAISQKTEEDAIRAVLDSATVTYLTKPLQELWKNYWTLDEKTVLILCTPDCTINKYDKDGMLALPNIITGGPTVQFTKSDFIYDIRGDYATVYNVMNVFIPEDKITIVSNEFRVLKKINGNWRINMCSLHQNIQK